MSLQSPESAIADALVADAGINAILGGRIAPVIQPESVSPPFINWIRRGVQREDTLGATSTLATVTLDLDCYAATYLQARQLANLVRKKLQGWTPGIVGSVDIRRVSVANESDGLVQLSGGDLPPVYLVTLTVTILWQEP